MTHPVRHTSVWALNLHRAPSGSSTKDWWAQTALHQERHRFCCRGERGGPWLLRDNFSESCFLYFCCCSHPGKQDEIKLCFCLRVTIRDDPSSCKSVCMQIWDMKLQTSLTSRLIGYLHNAGGPWPNEWDTQGKDLGLDSRTWGPYSPEISEISVQNHLLLALCINIYLGFSMPLHHPKNRGLYLKKIQKGEDKSSSFQQQNVMS